MSGFIEQEGAFLCYSITICDVQLVFRVRVKNSESILKRQMCVASRRPWAGVVCVATVWNAVSGL